MSSYQYIHKLSKIFQPISAVSKTSHLPYKDITSKSQKLLMELGIVKSAGTGCFHLLPLGVRVLEKLKKIIDEEMIKVNAQKVILPLLTNSKLWEKSGRLDRPDRELFKIHDRHNAMYILSPTHEESVTDLLASISQMSYKQFPLRLYQITSKFRDEMKPRFGLIRSREFFMKDLYTFDISYEKAKETYEEVCNGYDAIFKQIGVECIKVLGTTGTIGGSVSHEYHYTADIGEDKLLFCHNCGYKANIQLSGQDKCPKCDEISNIQISSGIEVGHTFLLGDKYSSPLKAVFKSATDELVPLQMGCYGLGLSRILAASVEVLSTEQELRWPNALAPYTVVIIPPKAGSKEEIKLGNIHDSLHSFLNQMQSIKDDILIDDRSHLTVGRRLLDARRVGYPYVIIIGSKLLEDPPCYELIDLKNKNQLFLSKDGLFDFFKQMEWNEVDMQEEAMY